MFSDRVSPRKRGGALYATLLLSVFFLLFFASGFAAQRMVGLHRARAYDRPLGVFWEAWDLLETHYYGDLPSARSRTYGAIRGALELLTDPYTIFLEPEPSEVERGRLAGSYGGIGVNLWRDGDGDVILSPYPDSPAEEAGARDGDILLEVNGYSVRTATLDDIRVRLRGEVGSTVELTLSRPPTLPFGLAVLRAEISIPSVTYRILDRHPSIGYIHITSFTTRTPDEAREAVEGLKERGAAWLVLDLRDNGGGLISPASDVADLFLDGGVVLYETRSGGERTTFSAHPDGVASDLPLVVLVNGSTASAAEIVAGAIQTRGRGVLIGDSTFGKGSIQLIYTLSDGSSLHVTTAVWHLPDDQRIGPDGLRPDILLASTDEMEDIQLNRAVRYIQTGE